MKKILLTSILSICALGLNAQTLHSFVMDSAHFLTPTYNDTTIAIQYGDSLCVINKTGGTTDFNFWVDDTTYASPPSYSTAFGGIADSDTIIRIKFPVDSLCQWLGSGWDTVEVNFNPPHQNLTIYSANGAFVRRFFFTYPSTTSLSEQNNQLSNLFLYPSPASDVIYPGGISSQQLKYSVINLSGQVLKSGNITDDNGVDIHLLPKGAYILHLSAGGIQKAVKFIKI